MNFHEICYKHNATSSYPTFVLIFLPFVNTTVVTVGTRFWHFRSWSLCGRSLKIMQPSLNRSAYWMVVVVVAAAAVKKDFKDKYFDFNIVWMCPQTGMFTCAGLRINLTVFTFQKLRMYYRYYSDNPYFERSNNVMFVIYFIHAFLKFFFWLVMKSVNFLHVPLNHVYELCLFILFLCLQL